MNWLELLQPELLILVPFMYIMSYFLALSKINNRLIPFVMLLVSTVMVFLKYLFLDGAAFGGAIVVLAIMQGAFLSMIVVTGDQVIKTIFPKLIAKLEPTAPIKPVVEELREPKTTEIEDKDSLQPLSEQQVPTADDAKKTYNNLVKKSQTKEALPQLDEVSPGDDGE